MTRRVITDERVLDWRRAVLSAAGFQYDIADELARSGDVDLHEAVALARTDGCGPLLAYRIVRPLP